MAEFEISSHDVYCPYCGESINIDIDHSIDSQQYVEDCQVCCQPIVIAVAIDREADSMSDSISISCDVENP